MAGVAEKFAAEAPGVESAESDTESEYIHEYRGRLADRPGETVRLLTLAPEITDEAVHDAFERVAGQWHNPSTHPNIVTVYDRGDTPRPWVAVADPAGQPLDTLQAHLSIPEVRTIIDDVAEAIRNASLYNTTHLDLTPQDVWVVNTNEGRKALVDGWGLERACRVAAGERPLTAFTAPELLDDPTGGTEQTDVYALGGVSYYAVTGRPPVDGTGVATAIREGDMIPPTEVTSGVPERVGEVVLKTLANDPSDRYGSVYAFRTAITSALSDAYEEELSSKDEEPADDDADKIEKDDQSKSTDSPTDSEQAPTPEIQDIDRAAVDASEKRESNAENQVKDEDKSWIQEIEQAGPVEDRLLTIRRLSSVFRDHLWLVLAVTVPLSVLVVLTAIVTGNVPLSLEAMIAAPLWGTFIWVYVPLYINFVPLAFFYESKHLKWQTIFENTSEIVLITIIYLILLCVIVVLRFYPLALANVIANGEQAEEFGNLIDTGGLRLQLFHSATFIALVFSFIVGYIESKELLSGVKYAVALPTIALIVWIMV